MRRNPASYYLASLTVFLVLIAVPAQSQESKDGYHKKSIFVEFLGSGNALFTANFDFRFLKGQNHGAGMRLGIGGHSLKYKPLFGTGTIEETQFTIPAEVNYIIGKSSFGLELGYSLTYISFTKKENTTFRFFGTGIHTYYNESGSMFVSYFPVGFRYSRDKGGLLLKLNFGPLISHSHPNVLFQEKIDFWGGLALGYSFY